MAVRMDVGAVIENQSKNLFQVFLTILIAVTAFVEGFDAQIQGYTAPTLTKLWHVSKGEFSPVFVWFQIGVLVGAIGLGNLGDILGRRRMIVTGVLVFGLFTVAGAYAGNVPELAATRFLSAIFLGGAMPNAIALIIDYSPHRRRTFRVGIMYTIYTGGGAAGGLLAAWLVPHFGWQSIYYVCGVLAMLLSGVLFLFLPESLRFMVLRRRRPDVVAATLRKLAPGMDIPLDAEFFVRNDVEKKAAVVELFRENRAGMTLALWCAYGVNLIALIFVTSWMPAIFADNGISYSVSVIATSLFQAGGAVGSLVGGWMLDRPKGILRLCALCLTAVPVIICIGHAAEVQPLLLALACAAGICIVGTQTGCNALSGALYPTTLRSTGAGWANGIGRFGAITGPWLGALLLGMHLSLPIIFLLVAIPSFCVSILLLILNFSQPRDARPVGIPVPDSL